MHSRIYKLNFQAPVHFGEKRLVDSEFTLSADTLFSAMFIEALNLKLDTNFLLNDLVISDAFPFVDQILYLPKPIIKIESNSDEKDRKVYKKLKYVPVELYQSYINGKLDADDVKFEIENFKIGKKSLHTKVAVESQEIRQDKDRQSLPYTIGTFSFHNGEAFIDSMGNQSTVRSGLYFIAKAKDETFKNLETVLDLLQYSGIGGKRSLGYGQFTYSETTDIDLEELLNLNGKQKVLLSTAMETQSEKLKQVLVGANYLLKKRTGFVQSSDYAEQLVKKRDFYSFAAGSVFKETFNGYIVNVGENGSHPVYRYAKALWLEV